VGREGAVVRSKGRRQRVREKRAETSASDD